MPDTLPARSVAMVAGEASGDLIASQLVRELRAICPAMHLTGVGGPRMQASGFDVTVPMERLAVRGYVEVLRHLPSLLRLRNTLALQWRKSRPDAFVGVDAPDFNLGLELALRNGGVKTFHLVCPSIWAWRRERLDKIKAAVGHMLCVFPFEPALLHQAGMQASFVGHPAADLIPESIDQAAARQRLGLPVDAMVVALMPGSRRDEIAQIAPRMLAAARLLLRRHPAIRFVLPAAGVMRHTELTRLIADYPDLPVHLILDDSHGAIEASDAVLVASGTATLEVALFKKPMVITYAMPSLSWWMMKNKGYLPWVGLPNILSGEFVVPELLQDAATPLALADAIDWQLTNEANRRALRERFSDLHRQLKRDFGATAAQRVLEGM
jgi:lipid-A-disaccharide synthase